VSLVTAASATPKVAPMRKRTTSVPPNAIVRWLVAHRVRDTGVASTCSACVDVSSLRMRSADWIAKAPATSARIRNDIARYCSTRVPCPCAAMMSVSVSLSSTKSLMDSVIEP
jgi:hypothetical protein